MIFYKLDSGSYRYNDCSEKIVTSLQVTQTQIKHFSLDLDDPVETTNEQWAAISKVLQRGKERVAAMSKSALIFVKLVLRENGSDTISDFSRDQGGGHSAWYLNENQGKIFHVSINVSDEELGTVALQALDACQPNYA